MQHRMGPGALLDAEGRLVERGWATQEVRRYDRAAIRAKPVQVKEWDYYCVLDDRRGLALTVADNGYLGFLGASWMDFDAGTAVNDGAGLPMPMGKMALPSSADTGDIVQDHPKMRLAFRHQSGGRRLTVDAPRFDKGRGLRGELWLSQPPMDRMVIATPFPKAPRAFYYNQKINCLAVEGEIVVGDERHRFEPTSAFAVLDWGRGVWTYDNTWYWGSASGLVDGRPFGFNIGYGFGDTSAASENMLFLDGRAHKLAEVAFHMPDGAPDSGPWRFSSSDGRFEMTFEPIVDRSAIVDLAVLKSEQHQVFGRFSGQVGLDDGSRLAVTNLIGFAEKVRNRW
ncbi:MAG: DUF2804 domain-containing protein [Caulobacter sp.]|nr:DUF2804 domain-containing protein [Caulobacter sp.]